MKKLKLNKVNQEELKRYEMWTVKGGNAGACQDTDGCCVNPGCGSKYGTNMAAEPKDKTK